MAASITPYPNHNEVLKLTTSQRNFSRDLYMKLAGSSSENVFFSPFSVMAALGMVYGGAQGNTKEQMKAVMSLSQEDESLHTAFKNVISDFKIKQEEYELSTSNIAYISDQLSVLSDYATVLSDMYQSSAKTVNFSESEIVRKEINETVEAETNSHIKDLIPEGILNGATRMVLVNAVYFKGLWKEQFDASNTRDSKFWISAEENVKVPMMFISKNINFSYQDDLGATVLSMDYKGSRLSMVVVLPFKRDGLPEVEAKLANMSLCDLEKGIHNSKIKLYFPKFKLSESLQLKNHLNNMGMKDLFDSSSSDLSGISGNWQLFVSHVLHKSFLEVDEKGTEAAAATGVIVSMRCLPPEIRVDHPFLFYIKDQQSGLILFIGRLNNPTA